jgi:hypothetical protein
MVLIGYVFIFIKFQEIVDFLLYFFYDPLIIQQCVTQPPIICEFSAVVFVVAF